MSLPRIEHQRFEQVAGKGHYGKHHFKNKEKLTAIDLTIQNIKGCLVILFRHQAKNKNAGITPAQ
jgi:hypothetical protein